MYKRILTLDDLITFCTDNNLSAFNAVQQNNGEPIVVQVPNVAELSFESDEIDEGMIYPTIRVCHTLLNVNGSYINEENMKKAMPTLKYRPLLAKIHQLDDGTYDFHSHDMHLQTDEDGNEYIVYDEQQIGAFTSDEPYLEYDEQMDKTYVVAKGAIPEEYTKAADIIRAKGGSTKVSCELYIYSMSFNAKEKYLELEEFRFNGCTLLGSHKDGTEIQEGMKGSKLTIEDFSEDNNSVIKFSTINDKLDQILNSLKYDNDEKGGNSTVDKFNELLEKYNKTEEDITFEYENMTDEELEAKFAEMFDEQTEEVEIEENEIEVVEDGALEFEETNDNADVKTMTISYELSHDDIRYALYELLRDYEEADNAYYYISAVYDTHFAYEDWCSDKIYGQAYVKDGDNISFSGERYNLHRVLLTDSEYAELNTMRSNYDELVKYKEESEKAILMAQKEEILAQGKYAVLSVKDENGNYTNSAFAKLVNDIDTYSVEELDKEAKVILADYMINGGTFAQNEEKKPVQQVKFNKVEKQTKKTAYSTLFK